MDNNFTRTYNPVADLFSGEVCAECRYCCFFSEDDIWELPVISDDALRVLDGKPGFSGDVSYSYSDGKRFFSPVYNDEHLFRCPALGGNGCVLGDERPLDCRLYPFRIVLRGGERFLAIAKDCRSGIDDAELAEFILKKNLSREMLRLADSGEINVVDYDEKYYTILHLH
ncbi:hypothetical protein FACS189499_01150 [Clostridia bacterium]|nr:hypothetical protein FACS189499_01150 [Clostridia bacterium]